MRSPGYSRRPPVCLRFLPAGSELPRPAPSAAPRGSPTRQRRDTPTLGITSATLPHGRHDPAGRAPRAARRIPPIPARPPRPWRVPPIAASSAPFSNRLSPGSVRHRAPDPAGPRASRPGSHAKPRPRQFPGQREAGKGGTGPSLPRAHAWKPGRGLGPGAGAAPCTLGSVLVPGQVVVLERRATDSLASVQTGSPEPRRR